MDLQTVALLALAITAIFALAALLRRRHGDSAPKA
jgi:hypothetical protein